VPMEALTVCALISNVVVFLGTDFCNHVTAVQFNVYSVVAYLISTCIHFEMKANRRDMQCDGEKRSFPTERCDAYSTVFVQKLCSVACQVIFLALGMSARLLECVFVLLHTHLNCSIHPVAWGFTRSRWYVRSVEWCSFGRDTHDLCLAAAPGRVPHCLGPRFPTRNRCLTCFWLGADDSCVMTC
jgi:hypothetical protein